ncbi:unnamed protein product [Urochloa humidicola]
MNGKSTASEFSSSTSCANPLPIGPIAGRGQSPGRLGWIAPVTDELLAPLLPPRQALQRLIEQEVTIKDLI